MANTEKRDLLSERHEHSHSYHTESLQPETEKNQESLSKAKDQAQLTATGAMSIVNIALLKQILDQGPEGNPYYLASLALIAVSLGLQIIAGILAIALTCQKSYLNKHKDDVCEDLCSYICGYRCICGRRSQQHRFPRTDFTLRNHIPEGNYASKTDSVHNRNFNEVDAKGCCPCFINCKGLDDFEYDIIDLHRMWEANAVSTKLQATESECWWEHKEALRKTIEDVERNPNSDKDRIGILKEELKICENQIENEMKGPQKDMGIEMKGPDATYIMISCKNKISQAKAKYLEERASAILKNQILKRETFTQNIINLLFFFVFIVNMFITGLGIVGNDDIRVTQVVNFGQMTNITSD